MSKTLVDLTHFPRHGYLYREPSIPWECPRELALQGLDEVAKALRLVRLQNPWSGMDPDMEACVEAIKRYTCARSDVNPDLCAELNPEPVAEVVASDKPRKKKKKACCGG